MIKSVDQKKITYYIFRSTEEGYIDASNLDFVPGVIGDKDPLNMFFSYPESIKLELLSKGKATIRDAAKATTVELDAQVKTPEKNPPLQPTKVHDGEEINLADIWNRFRQVIIGLASLGILAPIVRKIYHEARLKRRIELLFAGDQAAGKTALCERLCNPGVTRQQILNLNPTENVSYHKQKQPFAVGKFEVFPRFADTPGSKPSLAFKQKKPFFALRILVYVVAPSEAPGQDWKSAEAVAYRNRQEGYMKAFLEAMLLADLVAKPKAIVLFVNKFDLISKFNPEDSQAQDTLKIARELFFKHAEIFRLIAKQGGLVPNIVFGSALDNWNCSKVKDHIEGILNYGR